MDKELPVSAWPGMENHRENRQNALLERCIRHREQNVENLSILLSRSSIYPEARAS